MVRKRQQIVLIEGRFEFLDNQPSVVCPESKRYQRAGIAEDGVSDVGVELVQILVCQHRADAELAQLREHAGESERGERLEFVDVEEKGPALVLRKKGATEGR